MTSQITGQITGGMFILAGESSGDVLGARLMRAVEQVKGQVHWSGMGGPEMIAAGLVSSEDMNQLSVIGLAEALTAYSRLSALADRLIDQILELRPEVVFTVDSKAFSVRFARRLRQRLKGQDWQPKLVHMVAPTIWAWGAWRKTAFEDNFDVLLCLFPFEPELFAKDKLAAVFVGHPQADSEPDQTEHLSGPYDLAVLPGSRKSELKHHLPVMLSVLSRLQSSYGPLSVVLPAVAHLYDDIVQMVNAAELGQMVSVRQVPARQALSQSGAMMAASGTVTLEAAVSAVPGVVIYHLSPLNRLFARLFYKPDTPVLPDLILNKRHYPFLLPPHLSEQSLYNEMTELLDNLAARQDDLRQASQQLRRALNAGEGRFTDNLAHCLGALI